MNKYVFPGADASIPLNWVLKELEKVGFEAKQIDVLGVHYSATLHRWYQVRTLGSLSISASPNKDHFDHLQNWLSNEEKVLAKYGSRWFRIWSFFLASATIVSRQGGASVFQLTLHKNTNGFDRAQGIASHVGTRYTDNKEWKCVAGPTPSQFPPCAA